MHELYFYEKVSKEQDTLIFSFHSCIFLPAVRLLTSLSLSFQPLRPPSLSMLALKLSEK